MINVRKYLTGPIMVNTYLAVGENNNGFIVDPGEYSKALSDYVKNNDINIKYIILTHGHGDHICGVKAFKDEFNCQVVGSAEEKELFSNPNLNYSLETNGRQVTLDCDIYVEDGQQLSLDETTKITFITTPGHTKGGMCLLVNDSILFSGDTLFRRSVGRTDFYGGNFNHLIKSIKNKLFKLDDSVVVYPGHMEETTIGEEKEKNPFV